MTRVTWYTKSNNFSGLTLAPEDIAELDPNNTGVIVLFGIEYRKNVEYEHTGFECGAL